MSAREGSDEENDTAPNGPVPTEHRSTHLNLASHLPFRGERPRTLTLLSFTDILHRDHGFKACIRQELVRAVSSVNPKKNDEKTWRRLLPRVEEQFAKLDRAYSPRHLVEFW